MSIKHKKKNKDNEHKGLPKMETIPPMPPVKPPFVPPPSKRKPVSYCCCYRDEIFKGMAVVEKGMKYDKLMKAFNELKKENKILKVNFYKKCFVVQESEKYNLALPEFNNKGGCLGVKNHQACKDCILNEINKCVAEFYLEEIHNEKEK